MAVGSTRGVLYEWFAPCSRTLFSRKPLNTQFVVNVQGFFKGFLENKVLEHQRNNIYGWWCFHQWWRIYRCDGTLLSIRSYDCEHGRRCSTGVRLHRDISYY